MRQDRAVHRVAVVADGRRCALAFVLDVVQPSAHSVAERHGVGWPVGRASEIGQPFAQLVVGLPTLPVAGRRLAAAFVERSEAAFDLPAGPVAGLEVEHGTGLAGDFDDAA
jgi:hypothetical protein